MLTDDARGLLEAGSALVVGLTRPDGAPFATRAWGLDVDPSGTSARLLLRVADVESFGLRVGDEPQIPIAVTAADVGTLASVQVKGDLVRLEPADDADHARKDRYCDLFIEAIHVKDGIPRRVAARWRPTDALAVAEITLDEMFLQTPGPGAGASLGKVAG